MPLYGHLRAELDSHQMIRYSHSLMQGAVIKYQTWLGAYGGLGIGMGRKKGSMPPPPEECREK